MKFSKTAWLSTLAAGAFFVGITACAQADSEEKTAEKAETPKIYEGTAYVAGMGGHFAEAKFKIDPTAEKPITITSLGKVDIGDYSSHPTHDARIDNKDRNTMYWSTYKLDHDAGDVTHVGKTDLRTGEKIVDVTLKTPEGVMNTAKNYCASGQTEEYYMPITMTKPGYISVIRKKDMKLMHQVFLEGTEADIKTGYKYMHGINSPDMKELLVTINESDTPADNKDYGNTAGKMHMVVLDTAALEKGEVKVLRKGVADGNFKSTISFRQYYSPDGKYIANATGDILFLVQADNLKVLDAETISPIEQLHDAIFTPDGRYVVATSRTKAIKPDCVDKLHPGPDEYTMDGHLKLYDVKAQKFVGESTSTCLACHDEQLGKDYAHAVLCGLDVNWK